MLALLSLLAPPSGEATDFNQLNGLHRTLLSVLWKHDNTM